MWILARFIQSFKKEGQGKKFINDYNRPFTDVIMVAQSRGICDAGFAGLYSW